ncbi:hypothetical protein SDC9_75858 [bioreactor metagenome]|uniref:Uncharacterized protein n=1 Tax=bioreactor metagenome TaxID=1076179 RepID=A0A644YMU1_9ZZZZ
MLHPQQLECDTPDCAHWCAEGCALPGSVTIQEHHCVDYEEKPAITVSIEVSGGVVQSVYVNPDAPAIAVTLFDLGNATEENDEECARIESELARVAKTHREIY